MSSIYSFVSSTFTVANAFKMYQMNSAVIILNEIRAKINKDLSEKIDVAAQLVFLCSTISSIILNSESVQKCYVLSNCVRDLTHKVAKHGTLDPKKLGFQETVEVAADLACLLAHVPQIVLEKISPGLKTEMTQLSSILNLFTVAFVIKDIGKLIYKFAMPENKSLVLVERPQS